MSFTVVLIFVTTYSHRNACECSVVDDVLSRAEDCTFPDVVWQWLRDRDCTAHYNCCLPATTHCRRFCSFVFLLFSVVSLRLLILYGAPAINVFDVIVSP